MRFMMTLVLFISSLSSFAWIDLKLTSGNYTITARLTQDENNILEGSVTANTITHGVCGGRYTLDMVFGILTVSFENDSNCPGCAMESMKADVGQVGFRNLMNGEKVRGVVCSGMLDNKPVEAEICVLGRGEN